MNAHEIKRLLQDVAEGKTNPTDALSKLSALPFADLGCARYDSHRVLRNGFAEVIYCEGKKPEQVVRITKEITKQGYNVFGTRASEEVATHLEVEFSNLDYDSMSRTFKIMVREIMPAKGNLAIACGGTADLPVAEEAWRTASFFGIEAKRFYDVGIAGLHRVLSQIEDIRSADVVIAVAGMEGALPSVLGGLVECPIIALPTSVGYGANFGGIAALLAMLNSCSEGIVVTNIDNGFGAACAALRILRKTSQTSKSS